MPSRDCHVASLLAMTIRGVHRFNDSLFIPQVQQQERHAAPLQWRMRSAEYPRNLQLPMALNERRYRRNRCIPFIGSRYGTPVPSRDCHVASLLAMTNLEAGSILTAACTSCKCTAPLQWRVRSIPPIILSGPGGSSRAAVFYFWLYRSMARRRRVRERSSSSTQRT